MTSLPEGAVLRIGTPPKFPHPDAVTAVAFSRDGRRLATGAWDGHVRVWDVAGARLLKDYERHSYPILSVAFSPDDTLVASAARDNKVCVSDLEHDLALWTQAHEGNAAGVAFLPDGKMLASAGWDKKIILWDVMTAQPRLEISHTEGFTGVAVSSELIAACGHENIVRLYNRSGGEQGALEGHTDYVEAIALAPGGRLLASASRDKTVGLWNAVDRRRIERLEGHTDQVTSVAFSPAGDRIAAGAKNGAIRIWDALSRKELRVLEAGSDRVWSVAFSPRGNVLASGGMDGRLRLWDLGTGRELHPTEGHAGAILCVAYETAIASGGADATVRTWRPTGEPIDCFKGHTSQVMSVGFFRNGLRVVSADFDARIRVWGIGAGPLGEFGDTGPGVNTCARIGDSSRFVSTWSRSVWDVDRASEVRKLPGLGPSDSFGAVAASPDGSHIVMGCNVVLVISGKPTRWAIWEKPFERDAWKPDWDDNVACLAFSPDGKRLASSGHGSPTIYIRTVGPIEGIWDIGTMLMGHSDHATALAFSPDGRFLASAGTDRTVRLWDIATRKEARRFEGHDAAVNAIAFSRDGTRLVSGARDGIMLVWAV